MFGLFSGLTGKKESSVTHYNEKIITATGLESETSLTPTPTHSGHKKSIVDQKRVDLPPKPNKKNRKVNKTNRPKPITVKSKPFKAKSKV